MNIFEVDLILMESEIFFESYNHVYRVLKELNEDNFPMKKYIIENFVSILLLHASIYPSNNLMFSDLEHSNS